MPPPPSHKKDKTPKSHLEAITVLLRLYGICLVNNLWCSKSYLWNSMCTCTVFGKQCLLLDQIMRVFSPWILFVCLFVCLETDSSVWRSTSCSLREWGNPISLYSLFQAQTRPIPGKLLSWGKFYLIIWWCLFVVPYWSDWL